ncbi:MarR family transcriptional regulator [Erythrobacter sp. HL-111]|uniref:MarR family transcriptional regulator n=1 Tax=Erythrobacter sp. HL-111 TaxID=1798193 RepID=UPI0006DBA7CB|nr:MarR family transcriptional regulator [Erythrobacter sp. HL-111]KPP93225.1 MAG: transcriptional regulator [Erythrobacteraceae bacterium HL-111]SDR91341.1 DNA-binding transcriptional regulator, MarR family [Erythrobacter sp. HL-111]
MTEGRLSPFPDRCVGSQDDDPAGEISNDGQGGTARFPEARTAGGGDGSPTDLRPFADQLMAIARQLRDGRFTALSGPSEGGGAGSGLASGMAGRDAGCRCAPHARPAPGAEPREEAVPPDPETQRRRFGILARKAYAARRRRGAIFGSPDLFGEPAWDILLDLYIAHVERKDVSVSSACIGSAAPPTTGLRWLGVLAEAGFVRREHDPCDQRRVLVRLTRRGLEAMDRYFTLAGGAL